MRYPIAITPGDENDAWAVEVLDPLDNGMEHLPTEALKIKQRAQWLAENRGAISAYNMQVEANGVFSDGIQCF